VTIHRQKPFLISEVAHMYPCNNVNSKIPRVLVNDICINNLRSRKIPDISSVRGEETPQSNKIVFSALLQLISEPG
jgi:hypothetical protein